MPDGIRNEILGLAKERGALKFGDFVLTSGKRSGYYFDGRVLSLDPKGAFLIGKAIFQILAKTEIRAIGGPTLGADPIVSAVALTSHLASMPISAFIVRAATKSHGTQKLVEGSLPEGTKVAIVDDVCTTGGSLFRAIDAVEAQGCSVQKVLSVLDRHEGGSDEIRSQGYSFEALIEAQADGTVAANDDK
jgi:orotate phosphoribosyltransferase